MKRSLSTDLDPHGLSVLAYVRVRPSDLDSLVKVFRAWPQPDLLTLLDALCAHDFLLRDFTGCYWATRLGTELLDRHHIVAALEEMPPSEQYGSPSQSWHKAQRTQANEDPNPLQRDT